MDYLCEQVLKKYNILLPEEKTKAADELCRVLSEVYSDVEREIYITRMAEKLSVDPKSMKNDVERQMRRNRRDETAEMRRRIVSDTLGYGDRVNRDFVKNAKAARAEEAILGILLLRPELVREIRSGQISLSAEDFLTDIIKKVFCAILDGDDPFDIGTLAETFTLDEISRITKMQVSRASLSKNDASVLSDHIRTLKAEAPREASEDDLADIRSLLDRKKK